MPLSPFALFDAWLAPAPKPARVDWMRGVTFAHRGLHGPGVPENAPAAFAAAIARGFGIECDVQRSSDGQAVVFHDWDLDRLTAETGPLIDHSVTQLAQIPLTGGSDTIPSLHKVLGEIAGRAPLLIEIKSRADLRIAPLCLAVRRVLEGYLGPVAVMSFDPRVSHWFRTHSPHVVRGLVMTDDGKVTLLRRLKRRWMLWVARPEFLAYDIRDLPSRFVAAQRRRGLPVLTWTVRDESHLERAAHNADAPIAEGAILS